jgi:2-polyprenyl-3-methyl-5-hydroxy-6-metoxy-1,4-benzoquinol methylase
MNFKERIPKPLFREDGHYLGRPADFEDRIIDRRIRLVKQFPSFFGKNLELLDIGCGNGASMFKIANKMKHCQGIEITDEHLSEFNKFKKDRNIGNCDYLIADVVSSKPQRPYDRIISFEVIEHLENESGVEFYYNSLKKGGLMAITVPNKWWIFETHGAKLPLLPWNRVPFFSWLPKPIHERFANARIYTKRGILELLRRYNFEIIKCQYVMAPMDVLPKGRFKDLVINLFFNKDTTKVPFKATSIFVLARKN